MSGLQDDLDWLMGLCQKAGLMAQEARKSGLEIIKKPDLSPVTNGDLRVNQFMLDEKNQARPSYGWRSEEGPFDDVPETLSPRCWILLDPIDGTRGYIEGKGGWSISIAIIEHGEAIAGVIHLPDRNETYYAAKGSGAFCQTEEGIVPLSASHPALDGPLRVIGDKRPFGLINIWQEDWPELIFEKSQPTAYRLALVAQGVADFSLSLLPKHDWDLAAASIIVREAGGMISDHLGNPYIFGADCPQMPSLICAGAGLHAHLLGRCAHLTSPPL